MRIRRAVSRGFTLIEIAVVIAILGLMLVLGAMRMERLSPERALDSGARQLRSTLEAMRDAVVLRGEEGTLVYGLGTGTCRLETPPEATSDTNAKQEPEILRSFLLPEGVRLVRLQRRGAPDETTGEVRLRISPGGSCQAHSLLLGTADSGTAVRTLRVDPLLPAVSLYPEEKPFGELFSWTSDEREAGLPPP